MGLRLAYDEVPVAAVECDLSTALETLLGIDPSASCRIYCSYTAMLELRALLADKVRAGEKRAKGARKRAQGAGR